MNKIWFTADLHLGHFNILKYTGRPFASLEEMNTVLIAKWNARVLPEDTVFFLGDFCFKTKIGSMPSDYYENLLNGKIIFLKGNHDNINSKDTLIERIIINYEGKRILLIHNPADITSDDKFDFTFCGHVHQNWAEKKVNNTRVINVGVDVRNFAPASFEELTNP